MTREKGMGHAIDRRRIGALFGDPGKAFRMAAGLDDVAEETPVFRKRRKGRDEVNSFRYWSPRN